MSVSDPLLKTLKGSVIEFHNNKDNLTDRHTSLQQFCETLEKIFRKGIIGSVRNDYWNVIVATVTDSRDLSPFSNLVTSVKLVSEYPKVHTEQGRGRCFIRQALCKKVLHAPLELLLQHPRLVKRWYIVDESIIGNEILLKILLSILTPLAGLEFKLNVKNAGFLDDTWQLPVYRQYELVPCADLGIALQTIDGRAIVGLVKKGSVCDEDGKIEAGDVLDELFGVHLFNVKITKIKTMLSERAGLPIYISVVKCRTSNNRIFPPIEKLVLKLGEEFYTVKKLLLDSESEESGKRTPPHSLLPEDVDDEVPVSNECAVYEVFFCGSHPLGSFGGVEVIDGAIQRVLKGQISAYKVKLELGEKDIVIGGFVDEADSLRHHFTCISSCGRRADRAKYFAYVVGETTCTIAKEFTCFVFMHDDDKVVKDILGAIAQGFDRTHYSV